MNNLIKQLSQIEENSVKIFTDSTARKKELTAEYEEKTRQFDKDLDLETKRRIEELREASQKEAEEKKAELETLAKSLISRLETHYEQNHNSYVNCLFKKITEV